jgi:hypothetical protein
MHSLIVVASRPIAYNKIHDLMLNTPRPHDTKKSTAPLQLRTIICLIELGSNQRNVVKLTSLEGLPRSKSNNHQATFCRSFLRRHDVQQRLRIRHHEKRNIRSQYGGELRTHAKLASKPSTNASVSAAITGLQTRHALHERYDKMHTVHPCLPNNSRIQFETICLHD